MPLRQVLNLKIERYNALKFSESVPSLSRNFAFEYYCIVDILLLQLKY